MWHSDLIATTVLLLGASGASAGEPSARPGMGANPFYDELPGSVEQWEYVQSLCAADADQDGHVNVQDLLLIIAGWGTADGDLNDDGTTNVEDLLLVIGGWGPCPETGWQQVQVGELDDTTNAASGEITVSIPLSQFGGEPGATIAFDVASTGVESNHPGVDHLSRPDQATPWWYVGSTSGTFLSYTLDVWPKDPVVYVDTVGDVFDAENLGNLDLVEVRVWNDVLELHVQIVVNGDLRVEDWSRFLVFIDGMDGGTGTNPWGRNIDLNGRLVDAVIGTDMDADDGTTFRVWAPNADEVCVAGEFNDWDYGEGLLAWEGDGYWSGDVDGARRLDEYKFVIRNGANWIWRNDPYARRLTNSIGNSIIDDPNHHIWNDDFTMPGWNDLVIYEMHIGTFGVTPEGNVPGRLEHVTSRLDHLAELGVNAVELMPFYEFPGDMSWGYNPSHPFAPEVHYGTPEEFKWFVEEAHDRGIAVMADVVFSHLGPTDLDLWQFDGWNVDGGGGIYFYQDDWADTPWGPRPDYGRSEVRQYIRDNFMYWLDEFHIDGYRVDSTAYMHGTGDGEAIPDGWNLLQYINNDIDADQPWKFITAEDMRGDHSITNSTFSGGAGFDSQWDPGFVHPIRDGVAATYDSDRDMNEVRNAILNQYSGDAMARVIYTESHDEVANGSTRLPEEICPGCADSWAAKKRSTLAAAVLMASPGVPMLFQGQEFLEDGWWSDDVPLDWDRADVFSGILQMYKDLIACRRNFWGQTEGLRGSNTNVFHQNNTDKILAWHRWQHGGGGDDVVIAANFSNQGKGSYRIGLPGPGTWYVRFNSDSSKYDESFSNWNTLPVTAEAVGWDGMQWSAEISIGPYTAVYFSQ